MRIAMLAALAALVSSCIPAAHADTTHGLRFACNSGVSTATTLTQCQAAPASGNSLYVTDVVMSASVAATANSNEQLLLKYGTGSNCATGTTTFFAVFNPANGGVAHHFDPAIRLTAAQAICWMDAVAGSKFISVSGWMGP